MSFVIGVATALSVVVILAVALGILWLVISMTIVGSQDDEASLATKIIGISLIWISGVIAIFLLVFTVIRLLVT